MQLIVWNGFVLYTLVKNYGKMPPGEFINIRNIIMKSIDDDFHSCPVTLQKYNSVVCDVKKKKKPRHE